MFREAYIPSFEHFQPVGNTPAVDLLQHGPSTRAPGASDLKDAINTSGVNVLLLDCGDVRNVLYTVHQQAMAEDSRRLDFFCCEPEPAVLARNIILLSMLDDTTDPSNAIDPKTRETLWNVHSHFFLPTSDMNLLKQRVNKLYMSTSSQSQWLSSSLSKVVQFHDRVSLMKVHGIFARYKAFVDDPVLAKQLLTAFKEHLKTMPSSTAYSTAIESRIRAAGPFITQAFFWLAKWLPKHLRSGMVSERTYDILFMRVTKHLNFTFAISGGSHRPSLHAKTDPVSGFHLNGAFNRVRGRSDNLPAFVDLAKKQFATWCQSWIRTTRMSKVRILVLCGTLDNVCSTLRREMSEEKHKQETTVNQEPTHTEQTPPFAVVPHKGFDVVDCSSLHDYFGPWHVLLNAIPLLNKTSASILYTEFKFLRNLGAAQVIPTFLGLNVSELAVLFGSKTTSQSSGRSTHPGISEHLIDLLEPTKKGRRVRLTWRLFDSNDDSDPDVSEISRHVEPSLITPLLIKLYDSMFSHESQVGNLPSWQQVALDGLPTTETMLDARYNRATYAKVVSMIHHLVQTDWNQCMTQLLEYFSSSECEAKTALHQRSCHDLFVQLQRRGLVQTTPATPQSVQTAIQSDFSGLYSSAAGSGVLEVQDLPSMVYVTLKVPQASLRALLKETLGKKPQLIPFHVSVAHSNGMQNDFSDVLQVFGRVKSNEEGFLHIEESPGGPFGTDDLFVTALVSTTSLLLGSPQSAWVKIEIKSDQGSWSDFLCTTYGLPPVVHRELLLSAGKVWIKRAAPVIDGVSSESV